MWYRQVLLAVDRVVGSPRHNLDGVPDSLEALRVRAVLAVVLQDARMHAYLTACLEVARGRKTSRDIPLLAAAQRNP